MEGGSCKECHLERGKRVEAFPPEMDNQIPFISSPTNRKAARFRAAASFRLLPYRYSSTSSTSVWAQTRRIERSHPSRLFFRARCKPNPHWENRSFPLSPHWENPRWASDANTRKPERIRRFGNHLPWWPDRKPPDCRRRWNTFTIEFDRRVGFERIVPPKRRPCRRGRSNTPSLGYSHRSVTTIRRIARP